MENSEQLARQFETHRERLRVVAHRMLGSNSDADDAVQEAWLRISRAGAGHIDNFGGWLTTVVSRVCLDELRARKSRREEELGATEPELGSARAHERDAEQDAILADSVGFAMLAVLEKLAPAERVAFVLHDMFDLTFEEIAPIVGRSPMAARQLASRARRRVRGADTAADIDRSRRREVVDAFLAASRDGDLAALIAVLDPEVVFSADAAAQKLGSIPETHGAEAVAKLFSGRARAAKAGLAGGEMALIVAPRGRLLLIVALTVEGGRIVEVEAVADVASLAELEIVVFDE